MKCKVLYIKKDSYSGITNGADTFSFQTTVVCSDDNDEIRYYELYEDTTTSFNGAEIVSCKIAPIAQPILIPSEIQNFTDENGITHSLEHCNGEELNVDLSNYIGSTYGKPKILRYPYKSFNSTEFDESRGVSEEEYKELIKKCELSYSVPNTGKNGNDRNDR